MIAKLDPDCINIGHNYSAFVPPQQCNINDMIKPWHVAWWPTLSQSLANKYDDIR